MATFSPAIGCIAARYVFHEGFRDDILFPKFTGHFTGYLLSVLLPVAFGLLNCVIITIVLGAGFTIKAENGLLEVIAAISVKSVEFYIAAFILIGEELGWRAFLYDKLEKLIGLNFGKDAPAFPITNIALMCVLCIFLGAIMQLLRKMTDSVIAPIIAHAVIDTVCNVLFSIFLSNELVEGKSFIMGCCMLVPALLIGTACWIYMTRKNVSK